MEATTEGLDVEPELVRFIEAGYPPDALRAGREGTVLLELLVTATGVVDSVFVLEPVAPDLDAAAVAAAASPKGKTMTPSSARMANVASNTGPEIFQYWSTTLTATPSRI